MKVQSSFFKQFDIFSKPFLFLVGDKQNKNTSTGGVLSVCIFGVSILYFYYLINMYFSNQISPKITQSAFITTERIELQLEGNQIMFEYFIRGQPLKQFEKDIGKKLLNYEVSYHQFLKDGTILTDIIPTIECADEKFSGFLCLDENYLSSSLIIADPIGLYNTDIEILIQPCDPFIFSDCADEDEIYELIFTPNNLFQIFTKISQYNPTLKSYEDQFKYEYMYLDPNIFMFTRISFVRAQTTVSSGLLIQTSEKKLTIFDYEKIESNFSLQNLSNRMGFSGYRLIAFEINQEQNIISIQHPMITEVLAQFTSIFNSLLTIGILAKMIADNHIIEEINNLLLKSYYKKTAIKLLRKKENKNTENEQKNQEKDNLNTQQSYNSKKISNLHEKIKQINFSEDKKQYYRLGLFDRLKIFLSHITNIKYQDKRNLNENEQSIYLKLWELSVNRINIFELLKDIVQLKMAIKLILTKEQYSALQFCGTEINLENKLKNEDYQKRIFQKEQKTTVKLFPQSKELKQISQNELVISPQFMSSQHNISLSKIFEAKISENDKLSSSQNEPTKSEKKISIFDLIQNNEKESEIWNDEVREQFRQPKGKFDNQLGILKNNSVLQSNKGDQCLEMKQSQFNEEFQDQSQEKLKDVNNLLNVKQLDRNQHTTNQQTSQFEDLQDQPKMSHLQEMDLIEENLEVQEIYLKKFLNQMSNRRENASSLDNQIFKSLLIDNLDSLLPRDVP